MNFLHRFISNFMSPPTSKRAEEERQAIKRQRETLLSATVAQNRPSARLDRRSTSDEAALKKIPAEVGDRPIIFVRLPSGRLAEHGWQALRPSGIMPFYTVDDETLADSLLNDESLNLFGDDAGNVLRYLSPWRAEEEKLYYELDDRFYTTLVVKEWPRQADPGMWLSFFRDLPVHVPEVSLSMHHWRIGIGPAERALRREIEKRKVEARQLREQEGDTPRVLELEQSIEKLIRDRRAIISQTETLFHLSCYIRIAADSLEQLQERLAAVEEIARQMGIRLMQVPGDQRDAFVSSMPYSSDPIYLTKLRGTSNSADLFPLITRPHMEHNREGKNPVVLYGIHAANWTPVVMSPFNPDETVEITSVLGRMGSGKSYWLRCHLGRMAMLGVQTLTIDPLGDFVRWHRVNEGTIIEIAPQSPYHINPLRREWDAVENSWEPIDGKIAHLLPLFSLILGNEYDEIAKGLIGSGLRWFYENRSPEDEGLMVDFIEALKQINKTAVGTLGEDTLRRRQRLIDVLALNTLEGAYKEFFAYKTNINIDPRDPRSRKILFNLKPSGDGDLLAFATYLAITMALTIAKSSLHHKILLADEIHKLFKVQRNVVGVRDMLEDLVRTSRHWRCALVFATQFVNDDETNRSQAAILKSTNIWVLMRATEKMLDQTISLIGSNADTELLKSNFLKASEATEERRGSPKPMVVYRNGRPIPMFSVGLSFEDAEDDKSSGVYISREEH